MYIPPHEQQAIICSIHDFPTSGHAGCFRTKALLEWDFWWLGLPSFVSTFISGCAICQQNKSITILLVPHSLPSHHSHSVDLVMDLLPSKGHDSLMVVVDHSLIKGVIFIPCSKTIDVAGVAKFFLHHVFKQFRLHDSLISDGGPQFAFAFARELAWLLHYNIKLSTIYHLQTDGQTEQTNQEIETNLCIFCANNPQKWIYFLPTAVFHHNSVPHSSTKVSLFSLLYGYESQTYPPLGKTFIHALENCLTILEKAWKEALATHEIAC